MASIATPPPATPPAAPTPVTVHSPADAARNKLAAAMAAKSTPPVRDVAPAPAQPAPVTATPAPAQPLTPEAALAEANKAIEPPTAPPAEAAPPAEDAPVSLDDIDFDAPEAETQPSAEQTQVAEPKNAQVVSELEKMLQDGALPEKIEEVFLRHSRGKQMLASFKRDRDLSKPPAEGGIGRIPDAEYIKAADTSHRDMLAMRHEIENDPVSFVSNLVTIDPATGRSFLGEPEKIGRFLETLPNVLFEAAKQSQSPIYAQLMAAYSAPVFNNFFDHQYKTAMSMPQNTQQEQEDKARVLDALQISEFRAFGKARPLNLTQPNGNNAQNGNYAQPDPRIAELESRLRGYETTIQNNQRQQFQSAIQRVSGEAKSGAMADIDKALAITGVKAVYSETLLNPHREAIYSQVSSALPQLDPGGWQQYQIQVQQAARGQVDPSVPANTYKSLFRNALRNSPQARAQLEELVRAAKSRSDAQVQSRQESQARTEPNGSGSAVRASVLPSQQLARQPGETQVEYNARRIAAASGTLIQQPVR